MKDKLINLNVKHIVKKNLHHKRNTIITESFKFNNDDDIDIMVKNHAIIGFRLLNEGYTIDEIANYADQAAAAVQKVTGNDFNYGELLKSSMFSMVKEFIIKWLLEFIGFRNPDVLRVLSQGLADLSWKNLLLPWKNKAYCNTHLPGLLDTILEILSRDLGNKITSGLGFQGDYDKTEKLKMDASKNNRQAVLNRIKELEDSGNKNLEYYELKKNIPKVYKPLYSKNKYEWIDLPGIGIGNVVGELIRQSPTSEFLAKNICSVIHKD